MNANELLFAIETAIRDYEFSAKTLEMLGPHMSQKSWDLLGELKSLEPKDVYKIGYESAFKDIALLIKGIRQ